MRIAGRSAFQISLALASCGHVGEPGETGQAPQPVEVRCVPVVRRSVDLTETLRGRVTAPPGGDLPVASQVAGRIGRVLVREGDRVAAGTLLAVVDESASRDAFRQADSALAQAKANEVNGAAVLERTRQLVARGIAAKQELDDATAREDQARAGVTAATAATDLARRTLGRVQVRSTFEGLVTRVWRGPGALVDGTSATPVVQLAASSATELDVDATEHQLRAIEPGQRASITFGQGGDILDGSVLARPTALDPGTGLATVRIGIAPSRLLTLGQLGVAVVHLGTRDATVVPSEAIRGAAADGAEVVVCTDAQAEVRPVAVGWRDDTTVEILEGLHEGDLVAVDHVLGLQTGAPIVGAK